MHSEGSGLPKITNPDHSIHCFSFFTMLFNTKERCHKCKFPWSQAQETLQSNHVNPMTYIGQPKSSSPMPNLVALEAWLTDKPRCCQIASAGY